MPAGGLLVQVFGVRHDYYIIEGFTVDGDSRGDPNIKDNPTYRDLYREKLIYVTAGREPTQRVGGYLSALDGLVIRNMRVRNGGGECIRLRDFVTYADINNNEIEGCGFHDYSFGAGGKNGEGVYIGTSFGHWPDGPDVCRGNVVRENVIKTRANEGIDVKAGSVDNVITKNQVSMQYDPASGGIGNRGDRTIISYNQIEDADGAGVRLSGNYVDGIQYGLNNQVFGNTIKDSQAFGVKIQVAPQGQICGNTILLPPGKEEGEYEYTGGDYDIGSYTGPIYDARAPCAETEGTCSNGIEGIDGFGVVCCPLGCGQCGGSGCSMSGAANGLGRKSCCVGGVKARGKYCEDTGKAPCII